MYAWPLLETLFSEVLTRDEWLRLMDNLFSNHPAMLLMVTVAYCIASRRPLIHCCEFDDFKVHSVTLMWHTCIHAYMHTCIHAYMHTCIHAYMHTCIHAYTRTRTRTHARAYTHTHARTHAHTHTRANTWYVMLQHKHHHMPKDYLITCLKII